MNKNWFDKAWDDYLYWQLQKIRAKPPTKQPPAHIIFALGALLYAREAVNFLSV